MMVNINTLVACMLALSGLVLMLGLRKKASSVLTAAIVLLVVPTAACTLMCMYHSAMQDGDLRVVLIVLLIVLAIIVLAIALIRFRRHRTALEKLLPRRRTSRKVRVGR